MVKSQNHVNYILQMLIISLFFSVGLSADDTQRIADELASPMLQTPLQSALGDKLYNQAMESGKYEYIGNTKCRLCHREFFLGRKNDPHDHAMENLLASGNEKNSRCLICHSTGHGIKTGFIDMEKTPRLSNVQCEGCHGPGNVHIELVKSKNKKLSGSGFLAGPDNPERLRKMCASCHTQRWDKSYHDLDKAYNSYKKANPKASYK